MTVSAWRDPASATAAGSAATRSGTDARRNSIVRRRACVRFIGMMLSRTDIIPRSTSCISWGGHCAHRPGRAISICAGISRGIGLARYPGTMTTRKEGAMNIDVVPVKSERRQQIENQLRLRVGLFDAERARLMPDLGPLLYLLFGSSGRRQKQGWAEPVDEGVYEVTFRTPGLGQSYLFFACPKSNVWYAQLPHLILETSNDTITIIRKSPESMDAAHLC